MSDEKPETPAASEPPPEGPHEPDAPSGGDGDDDLLARLPPPRARRSPYVAVAVIAVGGLLLAHLTDDARYALSPQAAEDLGDARAALASGKLADNRYVAVTGMPDRRNALLFEPKGDSYRRAFWRLLGTDTKLLVRADETSTRHSLADRFVGRLRRFDTLPWAEQVRGYYKGKVQATRFVDLASFRAHRADAKAPLTDRAGDAIALAPDQALFLEVDFPDEYKVLLSKKQFAVEEDARHEMAQLGVPSAFVQSTRDGYLYVARLTEPAPPKVPMDPPQREQAMIKLRDAFLKKLDDRGFPFAARRERYHATAGALRLEGDQLTFPIDPADKAVPIAYQVEKGALVAQPAGRVALPWARVASIQLSAPVAIPEGAWVIVEGEAPADFRWVLAVGALVALFMLFNVFVLARALGRRKPPPAPATPPAA